MEPKDEATPQKADKRDREEKNGSLETLFEGLDTALPEVNIASGVLSLAKPVNNSQGIKIESE